MSFETILFEVKGGVAKLVLNRPDKLNSFNATMHSDIRECMKRVERDDEIRCLLITGSGRGFCAGQDLGDRDVSPGAEMPDLGVREHLVDDAVLHEVVVAEHRVGTDDHERHHRKRSNG